MQRSEGQSSSLGTEKASGLPALSFLCRKETLRSMAILVFSIPSLVPFLAAFISCCTCHQVAGRSRRTTIREMNQETDTDKERGKEGGSVLKEGEKGRERRRRVVRHTNLWGRSSGPRADPRNGWFGSGFPSSIPLSGRSEWRVFSREAIGWD